MRRLRRSAPVAALALLAPLFLTSSSVGSDPAPAAFSQGAAAVCEAATAAPPRSARGEFARLAARGELRGNEDVVTLNVRGYNYGPPAGQRDLIRLHALEAELRKSRNP